MRNDCTNAEIRDLLPDLLHARLDASARAAVTAHVEACNDCRDELQLLRDIEGVLVARTPRIDLASIVKQLPVPPARQVRVASRPRVWSDWRIAAAVTLLVAGGGSYALVRSNAPTAPSAAVAADAPNRVQPAPSAETTLAVAEPSATAAEAVTASADEAGGVGGDNRLVDLSEDQLQSLLNDINGFRAVPATEPEPVSIRVNVKVGSSNDAGAGT